MDCVCSHCCQDLGQFLLKLSPLSSPLYQQFGSFWLHVMGQERGTSFSKALYSHFSFKILLFSEAVGSHIFCAGRQGFHNFDHPLRSKETPSSAWCKSRLSTGLLWVWPIENCPPQWLCLVPSNIPTCSTGQPQIPLYTSARFPKLLKRIPASSARGIAFSLQSLCFAALSCSARKPLNPFRPGTADPPSANYKAPSYVSQVLPEQSLPDGRKKWQRQQAGTGY